MKNRLNLFQRTMLRWRDLHPYNAVHVVIVAEALDSDRLSDAIAHQLQAFGLADLELDRAHDRYEWHGGRQEADLRLLSDDDPLGRVHDEIARQLNAAFPADGRISPFRFFAVDAGSSFHLGLAYDHFVAGGDSIVRLLCGIVGRYRGEPAAQDAIGAASAPSYGRLFLRQAGALLRGLTSLPGIAAGCRRSFRPAYTAIDDGQNAFARLRLGLPEQAALVRAAESWGVTQNDLFMTILLKVLSPLAAKRSQESTRRELAVASVVNIRRDFGSEAQNAFVPLLASFRVSHLVPDEISVKELACSVHKESSRIRQGKLYLQTLLAMGLAAFEWRFLSETHRRQFFAKHYPVWAGTTPLNVAPLWAHAGGRGPAPEYLRAVSTGPMAPMICAISTADEVVNVGISYRTAAFDRETVDGVVADMLSRIKSL
jgi:hypothetical protein